MDKSFQTSFIPKKPITEVSLQTSEPVSIFSFIAIVLLVGSIVSAGGLYLYKNYLLNQKSISEQSLIAARDSFEPKTIKTLELFDTRTNISKQLLANHMVMTPFFDTLASLTVPSIQYTKFSIDASDKGTSVVMSGIARDYQYIALQAQTFNSAQGFYFKNVVFSELTKDKKGGVSFKVSFDVDPSLFSYEKSVLNPVQSKQATNSSVDTNSVAIPVSTDVVVPVVKEIPLDNTSIELGVTPTKTSSGINTSKITPKKP